MPVEFSPNRFIVCASMKKVLLLALTLAASPVLAEPPPIIDVSVFSPGSKASQVIDDVVVPVPSEIFSRAR